MFATPLRRMIVFLSILALNWVALSKEAETGRPTLVSTAIGVTRGGTAIPAEICSESVDVTGKGIRILWVGGLDGSANSVACVKDLMAWYESELESAKPPALSLSAVLNGNPDGKGGSSNGSGGNPTRGYPPTGEAYTSPTDPEAAYLWRWIGMHAPDLVVEVRSADSLRWHVPNGAGALDALAKGLEPVDRDLATDELAMALGKAAAANAGTIPGIRVDVPPGGDRRIAQALFDAISESNFKGPSPARRELQKRVARTPLAVAQQLSKRYGHSLADAVYIPAMAAVARLRLGDLQNDRSALEDVERIADPFFRGSKQSLAKPNGSHLSGHLLFGELFERTRKPRWLELARSAADLGFEDGQPKQAMPFHSEMSDAVFMGCPILAQVGRLTGEHRYFEMCVRHWEFMERICKRADGLYRHSPLDEAAWGRGNGFVALGLALTLSEIPRDHAAHRAIAEDFRQHLAVVRKHQDVTGCWHQVVDKEGSYREFTCTCMLAFSMIRGIRLGLLAEEEYAESIRRAWNAVNARIDSSNGLVDVCTGTGKQNDLRSYYDRPAILGPDDRGGAMALLFSTELARWKSAAAK